MLTLYGRKTKLGNDVWNPNTINEVIENERHCGDVRARKTFTPNFKTHKSRKNNRDRKQYIQRDSPDIENTFGLSIEEHRQAYSMCFAYVAGYFLRLTLFHVVALPMTILGMHFSTMADVFTGLLVAICTVSVWLGRNAIRRKRKKLKLTVYEIIYCTVLMIVGLGSVGTYLLDYLVSRNDEAIKVVVASRNREKMEKNVNIVRVAALIRGLCSIVLFWLSLTSIGYVILCRATRSMGKIILTVILMFLGYEGYVTPGYIRTSCILTAAGALLLLSTQMTKGKAVWLESVLSAVLMVIGSLYSFKVFGITAIISAVLGISYVVINKSVLRLSRLSVSIGIIVLIAVVLYGFDCLSYRNNPIFANTLRYRNDYERLFSFGTSPDYREWSGIIIVQSQNSPRSDKIETNIQCSRTLNSPDGLLPI